VGRVNHNPLWYWELRREVPAGAMVLAVPVYHQRGCGTPEDCNDHSGFPGRQRHEHDNGVRNAFGSERDLPSGAGWWRLERAELEAKSDKPGLIWL